MFHLQHVRKSFSILLLVILALPLIGSLLTKSAQEDASLPACCRRNGAHHCNMGMAERTRLSPTADPAFQAPVERCPFYPGTIAAAHSSLGLVSSANAIFAAVLSHPAVVAQTESLWRIARDRSRGKRGPPVDLL